MRSFVRQHRFTGHITDGINAGLRRAPCQVDFNESARVDFDFCLLQSLDMRIGLTAYRYQDLFVDLLGGGCLRAFKPDSNTVLLLLGLDHLGVDHDRMADLLQAFAEY